MLELEYPPLEHPGALRCFAGAFFEWSVERLKKEGALWSKWGPRGRGGDHGPDNTSGSVHEGMDLSKKHASDQITDRQGPRS